MDMDGVLVHEEDADPRAPTAFLGAPARARAAASSSSPTTRSSRRATSRRACAPAASTCPRRRSGPRRWPRRSSSHDQRPGGSAYVVGEAGLTTALHEVGYMLTERDPDYVVLGETRTYCFEAITQAIRLIDDGARFIATNPDPTRPVARRAAARRPASVAALISRATGVEPYFVGKPNPLMMRSALNAHRRALRDHRDDRRPHGHRHRHRARGRPADGPRAHRRHHAARRPSASPSARRGSSTRSPTWSTSSAEALRPARRA